MKLIEEQALERREHILEIVRQCIAERGVGDLTIRDLAAACRVSVPTLYRGFGSKEQLLVEAVSSFFNSDVLGDQLEGTGLTGAPRLLAIVDLCGKTIEDMPEYNQQLFTLFMSSDFGGRLGWDITESISQATNQALSEVKQTGELNSWVDIDVLAERIAAQCIISVLEFCNGDLSIDNFTATFGYSAALLAAAATTGKAQTAFNRRIRQTQKSARRQHNVRLDRTPGKVGE
ncbi:MAG: TetR/AcrR family transcriptional regulator [Halioglobus sp.]